MPWSALAAFFFLSCGSAITTRMSSPHALPPALPSAALLAYAAAHFGKSLLWYIGELLLIFALTEYVGLSSVAAGFSVAAGLLISAAMGVFAARRWRRGPIWLGPDDRNGTALPGPRLRYRCCF